MLDCPRCGAVLDLTARECRRCRTDARPAIPSGVGLVCRACGTFHDPGVAWCSACGRRLIDEAPAVHVAAPAASAATASSGDAPQLRVIVLRPDGTRAPPAAIGPGPLVCGRTGALAIEDPAAAPAHLRLTPRGESALAEDLGGRTGTFVRVKGPVALANGAELRVGRQRLRLELHRPGDFAGSAPAMLVQLWPDGRAKAVFPLRAGANVLGRDIGDVSFPSDRSVSGRHARLTVAADNVTLDDLGSSNGTFVRLVAATPVATGDQLLVGNQLLCIERIA